MRKPLFLSLSCLTAALALAALVSMHRDMDTQQIATRVSGEHWYGIYQYAAKRGHLRTQLYREDTGVWISDSEIEFYVPKGPLTRIRQQRVFAAAAPHKLVSASYLRADPAGERQVQIRASDAGYTATLYRHGDTQHLDILLDFTLSDHLALETHLLQGIKESEMLYWKELDVLALRVNITPRHLQQTASGQINISNVDGGMTLSAEFDEAYRMQRFSTSDQFEFVKMSKAMATETSPPATGQTQAIQALQTGAATLPVNRSIPDYKNLSRLTLELETQAEHSLVELGLPTSLNAPRSPRALSSSDLGEELNVPISSGPIQTLVDTLSRTPTLEELVDTTRAQIAYVPGRPAGSVLRALALGEGECVDYAELLTTLSRAAGLPSRTIYGLAYRELPKPGFQFHAWNEIYYNRAWRSVDPTWGQIRLDATHIALEDGQSAALARAMSLGQVQSRISALAHFDAEPASPSETRARISPGFEQDPPE